VSNKFIEKDEKIGYYISIIEQEVKFKERNEFLSEFNSYLVDIYCMKKYKEKCEPAYCTFQQLNNCDYLDIIRILAKEYQIDLTGQD